MKGNALMGGFGETPGTADAWWERAERAYAAMLRFFQLDSTAAGLARGLIRARQLGQPHVPRRERGRELMAGSYNFV